MSQIKVELQESMGSDRAIAEAAWTSSTTLQGKEKRTEADVERVVKMLIEQKHASPIESVILRFWIKMPIQTDRQHMTHRIGSHNGMSGRYRTMPDEFLAIPDDIKSIFPKLDDFYGPSHVDEDDVNSELVHMFGLELEQEYNDLCSRANEWYNNYTKMFKEAEKLAYINNTEYKRLREFFRGVLPQNNMTERVSIFNLRSFANYQKLRNSEHAQPEIKQVAELMLEAVKQANICPIAIKALEDNNWEI